MNKSSTLIQTVACLTLGVVVAGQAWGKDQPAVRTAAPVYADDTSHLWNRLHHAFFVRSEADDEAPATDVIDPPLWLDGSDFLISGPTHRAAIAALDEFLASNSNALVSDPMRRAILQHDLWSVFDWCASVTSGEGFSEPNLVALRARLARAIGKLALNGEEIASLPDNLAAAGAAAAFKSDFDPQDPQVPFLPADLLDPAGPWVCVRGALPGPVAPVHVEYYKGNSPFLVFIRLPEGREAALDYLSDLNTATSLTVADGKGKLPQFPVGTMVALLRQMAVIDTSGLIQMTPLTQSLQMRVYRQVGDLVTDHENSQAMVKFSLKRSALFAGMNGGLKPVSQSEPLGVSLLGRYSHGREGNNSRPATEMGSCITCHSCGGATINGIFTYKQNDWVPEASLVASDRLLLSPTTADAELKQTVNWKTKRYEWGLLKGLLDGGPRPTPDDAKSISKAF